MSDLNGTRRRYFYFCFTCRGECVNMVLIFDTVIKGVMAFMGVTTLWIWWWKVKKRPCDEVKGGMIKLKLFHVELRNYVWKGIWMYLCWLVIAGVAAQLQRPIVGSKTLLVYNWTYQTIGQMSCNPANGWNCKGADCPRDLDALEDIVVL